MENIEAGGRLVLQLFQWVLAVGKWSYLTCPVDVLQERTMNKKHSGQPLRFLFIMHS